MKFKKILVMAMAFAMLVPSFAFADDGPFIKDLSKLRAKPYEWQFYDENGKAIDKRVILAEVKMKAISARHIETHGVKIQPDGKEFVKDYFNDRDKKVEDLKIRIGNSELFEDTICVIKNQDVKYNDKELLKNRYLKDLGLDNKVEFADDWYFKEILYVCALPGTEIEVTNLYTRGKIRDGSFKLKVNEDCSLSPIDNTTQVDGDTVKMFLGKKPTDADKPVVNQSDNNKPSDKPSVDKPNNNSGDKLNADKPSVDKPNADKPVVDNNKPVDKVDVNKTVDKADSIKPVVDNKANQNVNNVEKRPAVANTNAPKTSDSSNIALYSMLLIGSVGAISVMFRRKLRTNK